MSLNCVFIVLSIMAGVSTHQDEIPQRGKVFYADFQTDDEFGRHYLTLNVGNGEN